MNDPLLPRSPGEEGPLTHEIGDETLHPWAADVHHHRQKKDLILWRPG
ncbi:MAG: hypothetical protein ACOX8D_00175 [Methanoculleus sp.]